MSDLTLWQIFENISEVSNGDCIYAALPWNRNSDAALIRIDEFGNPTQPLPTGLAYFLEAEICKELLEELSNRGFSKEKLFELIVHYAIYDAFPDLVRG